MQESAVKNTRSLLGTFYPTNHIIATFPSQDTAEKAYQSLRGAGKSGDEVMMLQPPDALQFFIDCRDQTGVFGSFMTRVSRGMDNESAFLDDDIERAKSGASFLVINSLSDEDARQIRKLLEPFSAVAMHRYAAGGIESMV